MKIQRPKESFEVGTTGLWDTEGQHPALLGIEKKCKLKQVPSFHLSDQRGCFETINPASVCSKTVVLMAGGKINCHKLLVDSLAVCSKSV